MSGSTANIHTRHDNQIIEQRHPKTGALLQTFNKGKMLGKGGFAKCYELTTQEDNKKYAVKIVEKASLTRSKAREKLNSQIKIHRGLTSKYVVGFNDYFEDEANVYIILELCSNQTLNQLIKRRKRVTEVQAKYYLHQLVLGIKDLHEQKVIHRDLKLGNLFINDKMKIKIGDFGLAAQLGHHSERRRTMCGTPNYIAPEILDNSGGHSFEVDIWSLGVIAYAVVVGRPPFETSDIKTTYSKIKNCNYSFPDVVPLSRSVKKFIAKMLIREPSRRATIEEILNDQFFTSCSIPQTLHLSYLACPPNSNFLKQYSEQEVLRNKSQTSRDTSAMKSGEQAMYTDRYEKREEKESFGRVMVRAASIDRVQKKHTVTRASSTAALMATRRQKISNMSHQATENHNQGPHVWVIYSQDNPKFGVCYMLNSGATGMKFNDSTCLISNCLYTRIKYYPSLRDGGSSCEYEIFRTPNELTKKMKIISHYQKELKSRKEHDENTITNEQRINRQRLMYKEKAETAMNIYAVKHEKTSKANIFRFSNNDYQVLFKDSTELLISKDYYVTYVNKLVERKYFVVGQLEEQSQQIKKRMNYYYSVMQKMKENARQARQNIENANPNHSSRGGSLTRSSSVVRMQKSQPLQIKNVASMSRLTSRFVK